MGSLCQNYYSVLLGISVINSSTLSLIEGSLINHPV